MTDSEEVIEWSQPESRLWDEDRLDRRQVWSGTEDQDSLGNFTSRVDAIWQLARDQRQTVPPANLALERIVAESRYILDIEEDGLKSYTEATWARAVGFLRRLALKADGIDRDLPLPRIGPADTGSIDLHWKSGSRGLLINVPSNGDHATYFGKKRAMNTSGVLFTDEGTEELVVWLTT